MIFKRVLAMALGLCFIGFAIVQYNDPDAVVWILIYMVAAVLSFAAAFNKVNGAILAIACILYAAGVVYCWPEQFEGVSDSMRNATTGRLIPNVEEGRESLGLAICSASMLILFVFTRYGKANKVIRAV